MTDQTSFGARLFAAAFAFAITASVFATAIVNANPTGTLV